MHPFCGSPEDVSIERSLITMLRMAVQLAALLLAVVLML